MSDNLLSPRAPDADPLQLALARTPARVLVGRSGPAYRSATWLQLREDHAAARDAVQTEVDLVADFGLDRIAGYQLVDVNTQASSKAEFLKRPDLGRRLCEESRRQIVARCPTGRDLQIVIGDGLSATAVARQAPGLLDRLCSSSKHQAWSLGTPFLVRYCRVGLMNEIGDLLAPEILVLLIGERPGLATAESLSAYLAYRPRSGHTDAQRNLISNIHARGVGLEEASRRIMALAGQLRTLKKSGFEVKELLGEGEGKALAHCE